MIRDQLSTTRVVNYAGSHPRFLSDTQNQWVSGWGDDRDTCLVGNTCPQTLHIVVLLGIHRRSRCALKVHMKNHRGTSLVFSFVVGRRPDPHPMDRILQTVGV
jgi:hypothetical protein